MAQTNLGVMLESGRGIARDDAEAMQWYRKAAEQGDAGARSRGIVATTSAPANKPDAWKRNAEQGDAEAQMYLGWMYANGRGCTP
ncbi:MAG: tetratricopeptide repeat protein [Rhodoplanes sp.]